jgi:hypothetical protein
LHKAYLRPALDFSVGLWNHAAQIGETINAYVILVRISFGRFTLVRLGNGGNLNFVCFYGCETCTVTLREEHRLRVFENRVLRGIFGPKGDEVTGEWRKWHSGELHNLYLSPDIIRQIKSRRMRWAGHVARMGEGRNVYRVLVGKPEGKRPLERPRRRWEVGNKMDLREIGWGEVEWIQLARDRDRWRAVVNALLNLRVLAPRS